jgi:hypothetical protein
MLAIQKRILQTFSYQLLGSNYEWVNKPQKRDYPGGALTKLGKDYVKIVSQLSYFLTFRYKLTYKSSEFVWTSTN